MTSASDDLPLIDRFGSYQINNQNNIRSKNTENRC